LKLRNESRNFALRMRGDQRIKDPKRTLTICVSPSDLGIPLVNLRGGIWGFRLVLVWEYYGFSEGGGGGNNLAFWREGAREAAGRSHYQIWGRFELGRGLSTFISVLRSSEDAAWARM
jgi:hypothetical protein